MEHFVNFDNDFNSEVNIFLQSFKDGELSSDDVNEYLDELISHPDSNIK